MFRWSEHPKLLFGAEYGIGDFDVGNQGLPLDRHGFAARPFPSSIQRTPDPMAALAPRSSGGLPLHLCCLGPLERFRPPIAAWFLIPVNVRTR